MNKGKYLPPKTAFIPPFNLHGHASAMKWSSGGSSMKQYQQLPYTAARFHHMTGGERYKMVKGTTPAPNLVLKRQNKQVLIFCKIAQTINFYLMYVVQIQKKAQDYYKILSKVLEKIKRLGENI
ncbi:hypothetical protein QE152_g4845 [Popillia japonica]|uniref:Uncharacterized protein n=1 Tax=Popillia japonica TaxID=7064 RepID=A0AAW1MZA1_POPJA